MIGQPLLLCVDLQLEFVTPGRPWADPRADRVVAACKAALDGARAAGWTIAHTQLHRGGPMIAGEGLHQPIPGLEPRPGEILLRRAGVSAYAHPDLEGVLETNADMGSVMIGFCAPMSITATLYDANDRGQPLDLLEEACGAAEVGEWSAEHTRALCVATARKLDRATNRAAHGGVLGGEPPAGAAAGVA